MKKYILLSLSLVLTLLLVGCNGKVNTNVVDEPNNSHKEEIEIASFNAIILDVLDNSILVEPVEGSLELKSSDKIYINYKDIEVSFNFIKGQEIVIYYDGLIAESYPAQINNVYKIELPSDKNNKEKFDIHKDWGILLETKDVSSKGLTIVCNQKGGEVNELSTGSFYIIQRLEDDKYINIDYLPQKYDIGWTCEAYIINKNSTTAWNVNWEWLYGELPIGKYRIGKEIMNFRKTGDYDKEMGYAYFEIR